MITKQIVAALISFCCLTSAAETIREFVGAAPTVVQSVITRPSASFGRTHVQAIATASGVSSGSTLVWTVTPGKTFWMTSFILNCVNTGTIGTLVLRDVNNTVGVIPWKIPANPGFLVQQLEMAEPKKFTQDVQVNVGNGTLTWTISITGYEE